MKFWKKLCPGIHLLSDANALCLGASANASDKVRRRTRHVCLNDGPTCLVNMPMEEKDALMTPTPLLLK